MKLFIALLIVVTGVLTAAPGTAAPYRQRGFLSPSRNIGCSLTREEARCDIREHSWSAGKKPSWCHVDWGYGLVVTRRTRWLCASDSAFGDNRVLPYGHTARIGPETCRSRRIGMVCRNLRTGHGFRIARASYRRF